MFFSIDTVDWWSLVFMDAALVSIFLVNPLLAALPLLFAGMMVAYDELEAPAEPAGLDAAPASRLDAESGRRSLFRLSVIAICGGWLLLVKMFVGAQWLASILMAVVVRRPSRVMVRLGLAAAIGAVPAMVHTLAAASASNTAIGLKPSKPLRLNNE